MTAVTVLTVVLPERVSFAECRAAGVRGEAETGGPPGQPCAVRQLRHGDRRHVPLLRILRHRCLPALLRRAPRRNRGGKDACLGHVLLTMFCSAFLF